MSHITSWRIGRIAGAEVRVRPSILIMAVAVVVLFESRFSGWSQTSPYILGLWLVVGLYVSVFVHELAHLAVARALDYRVDTLTLHFFGGETAIVGDSRRPSHEFWIAVSGPLASFAVAGAAWLLHGAFDRGDATVLLDLLAWLNLLLAIVNLLPGLPLDGGRAIRGLLWAAVGSRARATIVAAWIGRLLAVSLVVAGAVLLVVSDRLLPIDVAIIAVVAVFLWLGAQGGLIAARRERRLAGLVAADLLVHHDPEPTVSGDHPALSVDLSGAALLRAMAADPAETYRLVDTAGRPCGYLRATDVDSAYLKGAP